MNLNLDQHAMPGDVAHLYCGRGMFLVSPLKPEDYGLQVYGCPEDMPINRRLLMEPKDHHGLQIYGCPEDMPINSCLL
jgi:hypothetical protein